MKKCILTVVLLLSTFFIASGQNTDLEKWVNKGNSQATQSELKKMPNVVKDAGIYLEKSAKYQYAAIIWGGASAGLTIAGALLADKIETSKDGDIELKTNKARTACYIGAGACVVAALCCEITSINYKLKAGRSLRLYSTGTRGGLAYTF